MEFLASAFLCGFLKAHFTASKGTTVKAAPVISQNSFGDPNGITRRVVLLSLALAFFFGYVIPIVDIKLFNTYLGSTHLPPGAIAVLLVLVLFVNPLLKLLHKKWAFSRNELLTVYICSLFSTLVPGHGSPAFIVSQSIAPFYYATNENKWGEWLFPHFKSWLTPALTSDGAYNSHVVEGWYVGLRPGDGDIPWGAWLVPLLAWGSLIVATYFMLGCLGVLLRAQWAEREALTFPLLRLPVEMANEACTPLSSSLAKGGGSFFRNPLMWIGFGLAVSVHFLNGLNFYYPDVPLVPLELLTAPLLSEAPWNQIGNVPIVVNFIAIGVSYLLVGEISFSLWFFFWFFKWQYITLYYLGFPPTTLPIAIGVTGQTRLFAIYQVIGAFLVYAALLLWTAREHLGYVVRRAFHFYTRQTPSQEEEEQEALSYPIAFWGFLFSLIFIFAWCLCAGIAWHVTLWMWIAYLVIILGLTRMVAEGGILFSSQGWTALGPVAQIFGSGVGTWLQPSSLVPASFIQSSMGTDNRSMLLPGFLHSFKLARDYGIKARSLWFLIFACLLISLGMTLIMRVRLGYENGGLQLQNKWVAETGAQLPMTTTVALAQGVPDAHLTNGLWVILGGGLAYALTIARAHWLWFPLHPLGLLMGLSYPISRLWFSIFLGWALKSSIMRFGGADSYRRMMPAFLGLILGEVVMILFWLIIDGWQGRTSHQLLAG